MSFLKLRISGRLYGGFSILLVFCAGLAAFGVSELGAIRDQVDVLNLQSQNTIRVGEITNELQPGVVSLPHGWGHDRSGTRQRVANNHPGASINDVTSDLHLDTLSGTAAFNGLVVTLQRADPTR